MLSARDTLDDAALASLISSRLVSSSTFSPSGFLEVVTWSVRDHAILHRLCVIVKLWSWRRSPNSAGVILRSDCACLRDGMLIGRGTAPLFSETPCTYLEIYMGNVLCTETQNQFSLCRFADILMQTAWKNTAIILVTSTLKQTDRRTRLRVQTAEIWLRQCGHLSMLTAGLCIRPMHDWID